jgi:hypothetical protein
VRPEFADKSDPSQLIIMAGRHPVITPLLTDFMHVLFIIGNVQFTISY